jgi:hypothetical protein
VKWRVRFERVALVAAMAVSALSMWTAAPLVGLWVGSRVAAAQGQTTLLALAVVAITIFATGYGLARLLAILGAEWDRITGSGRTVRRHVPWLRSMRGERPHEVPGGRASLTPLEIVLVLAVLVCYVVFEVWFFFFSGSSIDQRSGR